jgi:hypothetical protein
MVRALALILLASLVTLSLPQSSAAADKKITVGNGTPASCAEFGLKQALLVAAASDGGTVRFNCGPAPVTIALTQPTGPNEFSLVHLVIPNNTTIDGGGLITFDGTHAAVVVVVDQGTTATLMRLAIINGFQPGFAPGGIDNFGTLTIKNCTVSSNVSFLFAGGIANEGTLKIENSTISSNAGGQYGGLYNEGALAIRNTTFADNVSFVIGGGIVNFGTAKIEDSEFLRNEAPDGFGGAIMNGGSLVVKQLPLKSTFNALASFGYFRQNQALAKVQQDLGDRDVRFLSITCDPAVDTPEKLRQYAERLGADPAQWLFLTGQLDSIKGIAREQFLLPLDQQSHSERAVWLTRSSCATTAAPCWASPCSSPRSDAAPSTYSVCSSGSPARRRRNVGDVDSRERRGAEVARARSMEELAARRYAGAFAPAG